MTEQTFIDQWLSDTLFQGIDEEIRQAKRVEFTEMLAAEQHAIWSHWMKYMFTCGPLNPDGTWTMPAEKVQRWQRQMNTLYADLTEQERKSDISQAEKIKAAIRDWQKDNP